LLKKKLLVILIIIELLNITAQKIETARHKFGVVHL